MPVVTFSERDLLRGKVVTPAWYRVRIESVGENPTTTDKGPSTNYPVEGTILFNGDTGDTQFAGVPTPQGWNFNSKAIGFAVGFLAAFGVEIKAGQRFDLNASSGLELDVFIENDTYQNRLVNKINHKYRAPRADVTPVTKTA